MEVKTAVIAAAGFGSRFLPFVKNIPKEMLPIIDTPSIQYLVQECLDAGIEKVIIVVREGNSVIRDHFTKEAPDVKELLALQHKEERFKPVEEILAMKGIQIIEQGTDLPYGNGTPFYLAKQYLTPGEPFAALFGDDMFIPAGEKGGMAQIIEHYQKFADQTDGVVAGMHLPIEDIVGKYANVKFREYDEADHSGVIETQIEKPTLEQITSDVGTYGRMVLSYKIFDYLVPTATGLDEELWLQDAIKSLAENGNFRVKVPDGLWITTGDPERYFQAVVRYYLRHPKYGAKTKSFLKALNLE
jgi:UTP--glucose-1-phosphate uridylyltransferase